jgi:hypothetical protein
MKRITLMWSVLTIALLAPTAVFAQISCSREGLQRAVDLYVAAQTKGDTSGLPLATGRVAQHRFEVVCERPPAAFRRLSPSQGGEYLISPFQGRRTVSPLFSRLLLPYCYVAGTASWRYS